MDNKQEPVKFLDALSGYIWINGKLIPWSEAKIHALTHSLHYSGAVFEGERAYEGKVFKLKQHTLRLINSAATLGLRVPFTADEIIKAHELVLHKNNIKDGYVRPLIWCGSESLNLTNPNLSTNILIAAIASMPRSSAEGLKLHIGRWRKAAPDALPPQCKSAGHYNMSILSQKEAKELGYDDALLLDYRGYVAECSTTNIFFVKDNILYTPIADTFLDGITRQTIIEIADKTIIEVKEEYIKLEQIEDFEECFITGTAIEVQKIQSIDLGNKKVVFNESKVMDILKQEYMRLVRI
jgi:branched-chain amino acid aminotransferase